MTTPQEVAEVDIYHVVCHDCPTEFVCKGESAARERLSQHRSATGHRVELAALG